MRVKLELRKAGQRLHEGAYDIDDNASFGEAFARVWVDIREQCMAKATSIGDLMDTMSESVIDAIDGAEIKLTKL